MTATPLHVVLRSAVWCLRNFPMQVKLRQRTEHDAYTDQHPEKPVVFKIEPSYGQWYFNIISSNGNTLATSERYRNKVDAVHAAQLIINQAGGGRITY
ncbi:YegP family protein [Amycolatopsis sp. NPDC059027]|uniref:YegP family protein n=1 Tax=Amycolatopsis sp. NPDC059027 TaxID=3346709 RepID=UPI00366D10A9